MTREIIPAFRGEVVHSNSLTVRLDQLADGKINYTVMPDEEIITGSNMELTHYLLTGAPMTFLGIMLLGNKLMNRIIVETLDDVNEGLREVARLVEDVQGAEEECEFGQSLMDEVALH